MLPRADDSSGSERGRADKHRHYVGRICTRTVEKTAEPNMEADESTGFRSSRSGRARSGRSVRLSPAGSRRE